MNKLFTKILGISQTKPAHYSDNLSIYERQSSQPYIENADGSRDYKYKKVPVIIHEHMPIIDDIYEFFSTIDRKTFDLNIVPIICLFAAHMSVLPASSGHHDSDNTGLFRHSLLVALRALRFYHTDEMFAVRRSVYDNIFIDERAIFILSMLHDFTKIVTDMDIFIGQERYNFYTSILDHQVQNSKEPCSSLKVIFRASRSHEHDNVQIKGIVSAILLNRLENLLPMLASGHDICDLLTFDSDNIYSRAVSICDRESVASLHEIKHYSLKTAKMPIRSYLQSVMTSLIKLRQYDVNSVNAQIFVTDDGILIAASSKPFIDLLITIHEYITGDSYQNIDSVKENPLQTLRNAGLIRMYGRNRVTVYHRLDLYDTTLYIKGIMLLLSTDDMYTINCEQADVKSDEIKDLMTFIQKREAREPEIIIIKKRSSLPYYLDESVIDHVHTYCLSLENSYLEYEQTMQNSSKKRYKKKMGEVSKQITQAKALSLLEVQRELESEIEDEASTDDNASAVCQPEPCEAEIIDSQDIISEIKKEKKTRTTRSARSAAAKKEKEDIRSDEIAEMPVDIDDKSTVKKKSPTRKRTVKKDTEKQECTESEGADSISKTEADIKSAGSVKKTRRKKDIKADNIIEAPSISDICDSRTDEADHTESKDTDSAALSDVKSDFDSLQNISRDIESKDASE